MRSIREGQHGRDRQRAQRDAAHFVRDRAQQLGRALELLRARLGDEREASVRPEEPKR